MSGFVPLIHLYAFMAWTWKTLPDIFCPSHSTLSIKESVNERVWNYVPNMDNVSFKNLVSYDSALVRKLL